MAFTVEDGTVVADANSLCSVGFADAYFAERLIAAWTGSDSLKQAKLIAATDYIEIRFGLRFKGGLVDTAQPLSFPRTDIDQDNVVPIAVRKAASEYALRALVAELAPDPVMSDTNRLLSAESHKIGPLEDSYKYATRGPGSTPLTFRPYPAADSLLVPFLKPSTGVVR